MLEKTRGGQKILDVLDDNEIFGEMGLIDEEVWSTTAFALEYCTLSVITPKTLHYLFEKDALSLSPLLEILAQRLPSEYQIIER